MSTPTVSVIIPTHDRLPFLIEALDSVHKQTFRNFEVIVVDDGSREEVTPAIADHPTKPRTFRQTNQGPAAARNSGLREARGELIAFLDSDDLWMPTKLDVFVDAIARQPGTPIFYGPMTPITTSGKPIRGRTKPCHRGRITEALFCSSFVHVPTVVCHKKLLMDARGFNADLPVCEDYDLWLRISLNHSFGLVEKALAKRRIHNNRLSKHSLSRNLAVKAQVLHDFYNSDKLNGHLNPDVGTARIARVYFTAGRAAFRNGEYRQAVEFMRKSQKYGYSPFRTMPLSCAANALGLFSHTGS